MNDLIRNEFGTFIPDFFKANSLFKSDSDFEKILNGRSDFEEDDEKYTIEIEVAGVKKEEIDISLKNDLLTVNWSRKKESKKLLGKSKYERISGSFSRSFNVEGSDPNKIEAELKNGVLKVVLYKNDNFKPVSIKIN